MVQRPVGFLTNYSRGSRHRCCQSRSSGEGGHLGSEATEDSDDDLRRYLEDLDPGFKTKVQKGDILVAGNNFGCGSSREQAPLALKVAGVSAVVARYFARIFYRNAVNIGLPVLEIRDHDIAPGDELEIDLKSGLVKNLTKNLQYFASPMPQTMIDILEEGGLVNYLKKYGDYQL